MSNKDSIEQIKLHDKRKGFLKHYDDMWKLLLDTVDNWKSNVRNSDPVQWDIWDEFVSDKLIPQAEKLLNEKW